MLQWYCKELPLCQHKASWIEACATNIHDPHWRNEQFTQRSKVFSLQGTWHWQRKNSSLAPLMLTGNEYIEIETLVCKVCNSLAVGDWQPIVSTLTSCVSLPYWLVVFLSSTAYCLPSYRFSSLTLSLTLSLHACFSLYCFYPVPRLLMPDCVRDTKTSGWSRYSRHISTLPLLPIVICTKVCVSVSSVLTPSPFQ